MKIIAFYSFKGGVGRTSALLNVAYLLATRRHGARQGATVALADWDVHAPGLTCLYDLQPPRGPRLRPGVVDVLASLAGASPEEQVLDPADLIHPTRVGERIAEAAGGDIWLVPAGAFDPVDETSAYLATVQQLQPQIQGLARAGKDDLVTWFGQRVAAGFAERAGKPLDYLLLDARTGLTEVGDLLLSDATDQVVVLFGLNAQNQLGMEQTLRRLVQSFGAANVAARVVLVASPVPAGEEALKAARLAAARATIDRVVEELSRKASTGDGAPIVPVPPRLLTIPYHPLLALDEALITERYPESDPGLAYARLEERVRIGDAGEIEEAKATVARAVERVREEREPLTGGAPRGEHPFARLLRWNVVLSDATEDRLARGAGALGGPLLEGLANSVGLSEEEKDRLLDSLPKITSSEIAGIARIMGEEQRKWRELTPNRWPSLAEAAGRSWAEWALLSGRRLDVEPKEAARRLLEGWPCRLDGESGTRAAFAAIDALRNAGAVPAEGLRAFLERLGEANPNVDFVLGAAAAVLVEMTGDVEAARGLFKKAATLMPSKNAFRLAYRVQDAGERLLSQRPEDALLLLDQAGRHYERALALKPDNHEAENHWGIALARQAKEVASRDLDGALRLWDQAGGHFERALALKPDKHESENNWGLALANQAKAVINRDPEGALRLWNQAGRHFERALALTPDKDGIFNNFINLELTRHHTLRRAGRDTEAQAAAKRSLELAQRHQAMTGSASYNLVCALCLNGRLEEALDLLEALHRGGKIEVDAAHLASDPDLALLAGNPRFQVLLDAVRASPSPHPADPGPVSGSTSKT